MFFNERVDKKARRAVGIQREFCMQNKFGCSVSVGGIRRQLMWDVIEL